MENAGRYHLDEISTAIVERNDAISVYRHRGEDDP
jgi:uncharacterized membrane protein YcaP (DUF421 family)